MIIIISCHSYNNNNRNCKIIISHFLKDVKINYYLCISYELLLFWSVADIHYHRIIINYYYILHDVLTSNLKIHQEINARFYLNRETSIITLKCQQFLLEDLAALVNCVKVSRDFVRLLTIKLKSHSLVASVICFMRV